MVFNRYYFQVLVRLMLIIATALAAAYFYQQENYMVTFGNLVFLSILQFALLLRYLTRWQRDLDIVAGAVRQGDYSFHFNTDDTGHPLHNLYSTLNHISQHVRIVKSGAEEQNQYFRYILSNSQVGLAIYDGAGKILIVNDEFKSLAGIKALKNIHELKMHHELVYTHLQSMTLNRPQLILDRGNMNTKLSARLAKIIVREQPLFILSLINITPEIEENELQSWQELLSILTHEIMNSIAPIHSLNGTMAKHLDRIDGNEEIVSRAKSNLEVINRRSVALMEFVDRYRRISTVPLPILQRVNLYELISNVVALLHQELGGIDVSISGDPEIIDADRSQIEQVVINLLKNAIFAVAENQFPKIGIQLSRDERFVLLTITDNGKGISREIAEKIFMPFFTTRPSGSGIGLTLSRQIMHRHQGTISFNSQEGVGTAFTLQFRLL